VVKRERARAQRASEPAASLELEASTTPALVAWACCAAANRKKMMAPPVGV